MAIIIGATTAVTSLARVEWDRLSDKPGVIINSATKTIVGGIELRWDAYRDGNNVVFVRNCDCNCACACSTDTGGGNE